MTQIGRMSTVLVRIIGAADGSETPHDNRYVESWDWNTEFGTLALNSTIDPDNARRFTYEDALREWRFQSEVQPIRPDGKPNRPLTAISVEIVPVWEVA